MSDEAWFQQEMHRQRAIEEALHAADNIIHRAVGGLGDTELNYLTARVAEEFVKRALMPFHTARLHADLLRADFHRSV
jgi:hypothetical protein